MCVRMCVCATNNTDKRDISTFFAAMPFSVLLFFFAPFQGYNRNVLSLFELLKIRINQTDSELRFNSTAYGKY